MKLIIHKNTAIRAPRARLQTLSRIVSQGERAPRESEVHLVFQSSEAQRKLNREYRGMDCDTDVLSFTYCPDERSQLLGEIYISVDTALAQSRELGHSLSDETLRLCCHGLLHILGYDHDNARSAKEMRFLEERYLSESLGTSKGQKRCM